MSDIEESIEKKKSKFHKGVFLFSDGKNSHLAKVNNEQVDYLFTIPSISVESLKAHFERSFSHKTLSGKNGNDSIPSTGKPSQLSNIGESFHISRKEQYEDMVEFCNSLVKQKMAINKQNTNTRKRNNSSPSAS